MEGRRGGRETRNDNDVEYNFVYFLTSYPPQSPMFPTKTSTPHHSLP